MSNKRPLLIIPPQYKSFEEMFNSQEFKDFLESDEVTDMRIDELCNRFEGIPEKKEHEYTILVGRCNEPSVLERFILTNGGQKIT